MKVFIPVDHLLDFRVVRMTADSATVEITSAGGFNLFPGVKRIKGTVDDTGKMDWPIPF
jgi:hypothetical protein